MKYEIDATEIRTQVLNQLTYEFSRIRNPAAIWQIAAFVAIELSSRIEPTNQLPEDMTWAGLIEKLFYESFQTHNPKFGTSQINDGVSPCYNMGYDVEEALWAYRYAPVVIFKVNKFDTGIQLHLNITE